MSRLVLPIVIGAGLVYGSVKLLNSVLSEPPNPPNPPNEWRLVGIITKIYYFPGNSCEPIMFDVIDGDVGTLTAPLTEELKINIRNLNKTNCPMKIMLKGNKPDREHRGANIPQLLSNNILGENTGFHFEFHQGVFDDQNMGIEPLIPLQHRPNDLVDGPIAWFEDSWSWIKIGSEIVYQNVQPRIRYVYTNHTTAKTATKWTFRSFEKIQLGIPSNKKVKLGDRVYVA